MPFSYRDPIHGFIHADPLEQALINSRPLQRLRSIHQLAFAYLVFPGAEHSRFSHVLGAMELAGKVYDALAGRRGDLLEPDRRSRDRRAVRVAALVHDIGHAPFSHSAEDLFEDGIDHEEMTRRLLGLAEIGEIFDRHGNGLTADDVVTLLGKPEAPKQRLLSQVISGELDVDKMDYLLRDSLYCGVRYGSFDLARILETVTPIEDPQTGGWGLGVDEGGVHALEALVMARYYMFTQVYFNLTGKALELHFNEWLEEKGQLWSSDPEGFLADDDVSTMAAMRVSQSVHALAIVQRLHYPLAFETEEHLSSAERERFEALLPALRDRFGSDNILVSNSAKDPHRLGQSRVLVRRRDGRLQPMEEASQFIRHLARIERFRVYTPERIQGEVATELGRRWPS
ncbi:MAG: HD domain-containing protein [Acidobacteriota bacterium]|nr:HD domain-containing protein [Acidobacteriota bacterium]